MDRSIGIDIGGREDHLAEHRLRLRMRGGIEFKRLRQRPPAHRLRDQTQRR